MCMRGELTRFQHWADIGLTLRSAASVEAFLWSMCQCHMPHPKRSPGFVKGMLTWLNMSHISSTC
jgi:hypothetical protein